VSEALEFPRRQGPIVWALIDVGASRVIASPAPPILAIRHETAFTPTEPVTGVMTEIVTVGDPPVDVHRYAMFPIVPLRSPTCPPAPVVVLGELEVRSGPLDVGLRQLRDELAPLAGEPVIEVRELITLTEVRCRPDRTLAFRTRHLIHRAHLPRIDEMLRPVGAPDTAPLVLLLAQDQGVDETTGELGDIAKVVTWRPSTAAAELRHQASRRGTHVLSSAGPDLALLLSAMFADAGDTVASTLVPLAGPAPVTVFPDELLLDFVVLPPDELYNRADLRFYRQRPPLQRTPLPARLAPVGSRPSGDLHAIRLP
jgi:hypothetical protein